MCIAVILAAVSSLYSRPQLAYIDFDVLAILLSLMLVVAELKEIRFLDWLAVELLNKCRSKRQLELVLLAVTAAVVAYTQIVVTEEGYYSIVLKETVNGRNCVYVEDRGHLIRLKCGEDVDFDALTLRDERGDTISYQMDFQWNRLTRTGTVSACEDTGVTVLGGVMDVTYEGDSGSVPLLFGDTSVQYLRDGYYPDPYAESENLVFLCDVRFWPYHPEEPDPTGINTRAILEVEDCINAEALDVDGDGALEVAVRTRWPEKPYTVYDYVDGEIVESWPDTLPEEILEQMWAPWEGL